MQQTTIEALNRAYQLLQNAATELYLAADKAVETENNPEAELLRIQADRICRTCRKFRSIDNGVYR